MSWVRALAACEAAGAPSVLVTVLQARGSTPREAGAKMLVEAAAQHGTIGGGALEKEATEIARGLLASGGLGPVQRAFPLGPALQQCCGGHATLLFEPLRPVQFQVALFGAGHVGQAVARLLADLPCGLTWVDSRAEAFPAGLPMQARQVVAAQPERAVTALPPGSHLLVMTHSHAQDYEIVAAALGHGGFASIGLIGSLTKRARFLARLRRDGVPEAALARLQCPIGLPGLAGKLPAQIAISVVASLLQQSAHEAARLPDAVAAGADCAVAGCSCRKVLA
jgi:xanthine dehydrogenase accessory factor